MYVHVHIYTYIDHACTLKSNRSTIEASTTNQVQVQLRPPHTKKRQLGGRGTGRGLAWPRARVPFKWLRLWHVCN